MGGNRWVGLASRARTGDREAFGELVDMFKESLCASVYPLVRDWHGTQDVAQEAFAIAYSQLETMRPEQFRPWLFRIAHNQAVSRFRQRRRRRTSPVARIEGLGVKGVVRGAACLRSDAAGDRGPSGAALDRVRRAVLALPNGYGAILAMRYLEEMSVGEMAEVLGRTRKAVRSALYRARSVARDQLEKCGLDLERILHEM